MGDALLPMPGGLLSKRAVVHVQPNKLYQITANKSRCFHAVLCLSQKGMVIIMKSGRVTIPTDENYVEGTKIIAEKWGADAVRDCGGAHSRKITNGGNDNADKQANYYGRGGNRRRYCRCFRGFRCEKCRRGRALNREE
ncbi:MAG: 1,3-beta-galactosyl-N-acetylhexosamine phosphorylase N-terminal domain-containing protein [Candidatus Scatosoma sp.]